MTGRADDWIKRTTTGCVALLALIAGTVPTFTCTGLLWCTGSPVGSFAHAAVRRRDDRGRVGHAAGRVEGWPTWCSAAVGAARGGKCREPSRQCRGGRAIADWARDRGVAVVRPYRVVGTADSSGTPERPCRRQPDPCEFGDRKGSATDLAVRAAVSPAGSRDGSELRREVQRHAWRWALANRASDGTLPAGSEIARQYGRGERWGRLVKRAGLEGEFAEIAPDEAIGEVVAPRSAA